MSSEAAYRFPRVQEDRNPPQWEVSRGTSVKLGAKQLHGFLWGVGSSAYQTEGAWHKDGKGTSIWDAFTHAKGKVLRNETGDSACDGYYKVKDDIQLLKELKVNHYLFSISWPRIMPTGIKTEQLNEKGIQFYNDTINSLLENTITPIVSLYHWDLPQVLQEQYGGWQNISTINYFNDYANLCFEKFGDRVKHRIAFSNPWDGANVKGYTAWSLLDKFEWNKGFSERFGFYHIDFQNKNKPPYPKASADYYKKIISANGVPNPREACARPLISVYSEKGEASGKNVTLPAVFKAPIRPDVVNFVHTNLRKNNRQPYAVSELAACLSVYRRSRSLTQLFAGCLLSLFVDIKKEQ
ncbi:lactase-like protein [Podargus strigoides]